MVEDIRKKPIGIFDSGVGGLTVYKEIRSLLPREDVVYLGDTARVPYGTKSERVVKRYALEATLFLLSKGVKCIVIACNTASSLALPDLSRIIPVPFLGVISPGAREAVRLSRSGRIGVIGTEATVSSRAYEREIKLLRSDAQVFQVACPLFVFLAEEGHINNGITRMAAEMYLSPLKGVIDTLILGCTHYPLLGRVIKSVLPGVNIVDSATSVARSLEEELKTKGLLNEKGTGSTTFYVTDDPFRFSKVAKLFLGRNVDGEVRFVKNLELF